MKTISLFALMLFPYLSIGQIAPQASPYYGDGMYNVVSDSVESISPNVLWYRPDTDADGSFPVLLFCPGANGFFQSAINRHTYDLFVKHLASYGYVVGVVDQTSAGLPSGDGFETVYDWMMSDYGSGGWTSTYIDTSKVSVGGHSNGGVNATDFLLDHQNEIKSIVYFASYPSDNPILPHDMSNYSGKVLSLAGDEEGSSDTASFHGGFNSYTSRNCGVYTSFAGLDHGAFGDYDNPDQPVGSIGRTDATASIRHFFVGFMEMVNRDDVTASEQILDPANHPTSVSTFDADCEILTNGGGPTYISEDSPQTVSQFGNTFLLSESVLMATLYDLQGKVVWQERFSGFRLEIPVAHSGVYVLSLNVSGNIQNQKVYLD